MFLTSIRKNKATILTLMTIFAVMGILGCGMRQSQTGSLSGRIVNSSGDAVPNAKVYSIFAEEDQVYTGGDGGFYLAELPAGLNNIVILHDDYAVEERSIEVRSNETTVVEAIKLDQANAPHKISNVTVAEVSSSTARITWKTYRSVACNIDYGVTQGYGQIYREERAAVEHVAVLKSLSPETLYHFRVQYIDESAVSHYSYDFPFKTDMGDRPSMPQSISVAGFTELGKVTLNWEAATGSSVVGYSILRREKGGEWQQINDNTIPANIKTYTDQNLETGRLYQYSVVSVNSVGATSALKSSNTIFVPGVVGRDLVLESSDSPIILTTDLIIAAGANLQVASGVQFQIAEKDSMGLGLDEDRVEILVHGRIALNGTEDNPVAFRPLDGSGRRDHWAGIKILSSKTGISEFHHVNIFGCTDYALNVEAKDFKVNNIKVKYCENGLRLKGIDNFVYLDACKFEEIASAALYIEECRRINVHSCQFDGVNTGIYNQTTDSEDQLDVQDTDIEASKYGIRGIIGKSKIKNVLIVSPSGVGMEFTNFLNTRDNYVDHCTIDALNGIIVKLGTVVMENNIVTATSLSGETGINNLSVITPTYDFNNVYGFATPYSGCGLGDNSLQITPKFVGGIPYDYNLLTDSTLKLEDRYGNEMGRYGPSRL